MTRSTPMASPRPRTSPIRGCRSASSRSPSASAAPVAAARAGRSSSRSVRSTARPALAQTGFPAVVRMANAVATSINAAGPTTAESGSPPPSPLPNVITSGSMPSASNACSQPVRPIPTFTSSQTSRMPWRRQRSWSPRRNPSGGTIMPPSAWIGSTNSAARSPGSTSSASTRSSSARTPGPGSPNGGRYGSG